VKLDELYACQPGIPICHPGGVGVIICPCQNPPAGPGQGCDNSSATGGAALSSTGAASLAADSVQLTASDERPTALSIFLQGDANLASGVIFGQGVRCTGGHLKRLYVKNAVAGMVVAPVGTDLSIHAQSAALGDTIVAGSHRYYGVYYRDPVVLGGCPSASTFNITQQLDVLWGA
jgi:hypothetical protein